MKASGGSGNILLAAAVADVVLLVEAAGTPAF